MWEIFKTNSLFSQEWELIPQHIKSCQNSRERYKDANPSKVQL